MDKVVKHEAPKELHGIALGSSRREVADCRQHGRKIDVFSDWTEREATAEVPERNMNEQRSLVCWEVTTTLSVMFCEYRQRSLAIASAPPFRQANYHVSIIPLFQ